MTPRILLRHCCCGPNMPKVIRACFFAYGLVKLHTMCESLSQKLILASGSPRRGELLHAAGYDFEVVIPPYTEPAGPPTRTFAAAAWAEALAYFKARSVAQLHPYSVIIGADTLVVHGDQIIGKARDVQDARRILSTLFAGRSEVITGLTVLCLEQNKRIISHETTSLIMRPMNPNELEDYLRSGAWRDKAGAYALQEGGDKFLQSMEGSESNVVGLPMERLKNILLQFQKPQDADWCI